MTLIIFIIGFFSLSLGICYSDAKFISGLNIKKQNFIKVALWILLCLAIMTAYSFAAQTNFPFNSQSINANIFDTVNFSDYYDLFQHVLLLLMITVPIYYVLKWTRIPIYYLIIALGITSILIYYPGIPCADTTDLYNYVQSNNYSDWQPVLYTIFWHISNNYGSAFIANTFFYYIGITVISIYFHKSNKFWQNYLLFLACGNPIFYSQLNIVLKDTLFIGLLVDLIAIYLIIDNVKSRNKRIALTVLAFVIAFLCCGIRYNGILAIFPFTVLFVLKWMSHVKLKNVANFFSVITITIILNAAIVQLNLFVSYSFFHAKKVYSPTLVMYNDLVNIECATNHAFEVPRELLNHEYNEQDIRSNMCNPIYINYFNYDPISGDNWNNSGNKSILNYDQSYEKYLIAKSAWVNAIIHYPIEYVTYRMRFATNDLLKQWYMPPYFELANQFYPSGVEHPNTNDFSAKLQLLIAKIAFSQQIEIRLIGLIILTSIFGFLGFMLLNSKITHLSKAIFYSNLISIMGLYLVVGENAARFFLWNYLSCVLMIIFAIDTLKARNIEAIEVIPKNKTRKNK